MKTATDKAIKQAEQEFADAGGLSALVNDLLELSAQVEVDDVADPDNHEWTDDENFIDCRLRYHDGAWSFLTGDSSYDQDHRGHWGASSVGPNMTEDEALDIATDLYEQVLDDLASSL